MTKQEPRQWVFRQNIQKAAAKSLCDHHNKAITSLCRNRNGIGYTEPIIQRMGNLPNGLKHGLPS